MRAEVDPQTGLNKWADLYTRRPFTPTFNSMSRSPFVVSICAALLLSACATSRTEKTESPSAAKPAEVTTPSTPPVKIPAASARKVVLYMTGPKNVVEAKDWPSFKREWHDTFSAHAKAAGIEFRSAEGDTPPRGEAGTLLHVTVADYRMVGIGARIFLGVMTGNAYIDARVRFADLRDGSTFGEQQHNTSSSAWGGVFAKVTPQQVDALATDVFKDIKSAR